MPKSKKILQLVKEIAKKKAQIRLLQAIKVKVREVQEKKEKTYCSNRLSMLDKKLKEI